MWFKVNLTFFFYADVVNFNLIIFKQKTVNRNYLDNLF